MQLTAQDVIATVDELLSGRRTRQEASRWAYDLLCRDDRGQLEVRPEAHRDAVWEAVLYLLGFDLEVAPTEYLHDPGELTSIRAALQRLR